MKAIKVLGWAWLLGLTAGWILGASSIQESPLTHKVKGKVGWSQFPAQAVMQKKQEGASDAQFWICMNKENEFHKGFSSIQKWNKSAKIEDHGRKTMNKEQQIHSWEKVQECMGMEQGVKENQDEIWFRQCHQEWFLFGEKDFNSCHYLKTRNQTETEINEKLK